MGEEAENTPKIWGCAEDGLKLETECVEVTISLMSDFLLQHSVFQIWVGVKTGGCTDPGFPGWVQSGIREYNVLMKDGSFGI